MICAVFRDLLSCSGNYVVPYVEITPLNKCKRDPEISRSKFIWEVSELKWVKLFVMPFYLGNENVRE